MLFVSQAFQLILNQAKLNGIESCPLAKACGRILREDIKADRNQPPFDKALMDGIAISFRTWQEGHRSFQVQAVIPAGKATIRLSSRFSCAQIMTGAVLPKGCDCIIPIEYVHIQDDLALVDGSYQAVQGDFIRLEASDCNKNTLILKKGIVLNPTQIGIIASLGKSLVLVSKRFSVAVISTGNELVDVGKPIQYFQTRVSNSYALKALLDGNHCEQVDVFYLKDHKKLLLEHIAKILNSYEMLVISGGVSKGKFDFVPEVLHQLGVKQVFHQVAQKPGKPLWFGMFKDKPVFALPGNPISTLVCACRYVVPYIKKSSGAEIPEIKISVGNLPKMKTDMTHFLPVLNGNVVPTGGSGDFTSLAQTDGFIEYDPSKKTALRPYFSWR